MSNIRRDDVDRFFEYGLDVPSRTIYLGGSCTEHKLAEAAVKSLHLLGQKEENILILLNNPGGDEYHGLAIYDAISNCKAHVTVRGYGHVMSMASWIMQAADNREMTPNATMMVHYGSWEFEGHAKDAMRWAKEGERLNRLMEDAYLVRIKEKHPRYNRSKLQLMLDHDSFLTAKDAVELGLADKVAGE